MACRIPAPHPGACDPSPVALCQQNVLCTIITKLLELQLAVLSGSFLKWGFLKTPGRGQPLMLSLLIQTLPCLLDAAWGLQWESFPLPTALSGKTAAVGLSMRVD